MKITSKKIYSVGELVRIPCLPRRDDDSNIWLQDPNGPHIGLVVTERSEGGPYSALVGQVLGIELGTGEVVKLSSNLVESLD